MLLNETIDDEVICYGATDDELETFRSIAFILEAIIQPIIGIAGLLANILAIPLLCRYTFLPILCLLILIVST